MPIANRPSNTSPRLAATALTVGFFVLASTGNATAQELREPAQNAAAGARVFGSRGCVECHSVRGLGGRGGPDLAGIGQRRSFHGLAAAIWNHLSRSGERAGKKADTFRMGARETADLFAFLYTTGYFDPPGDLEAGSRLFADKNCILCHQARGVGGVVGPNLDFVARYGSPISVAAAMWNHGPAMAEAMRGRGIERPRFTGSELLDLLSWLQSQSQEFPVEPVYVLPGSAERGGDLFDSKGCVHCHGVGGRGGGVGPNLANRSLDRSLVQFAAAMWNKAPAMIGAMRTRGISVPHLTPGEMADIVAYLYSVRYFSEAGSAAAGMRILRSKGCLACHSLGDAGGRSAGDLTDVQGLDSATKVVSAMWHHFGLEGEPGWGPLAWPLLRADEMADLVAFLQASGREP